MKRYLLKPLLLIFGLMTTNAYSIECECPATYDGYWQKHWRLMSSETTETNEVVWERTRMESWFPASELERITSYLDKYPIVVGQSNSFYWTGWNPKPLRVLRCLTATETLPNGYELISNTAGTMYRTNVYDLDLEWYIKEIKCNYCEEDDINHTNPEGWQEKPDLYSTNSCTQEETGSIEACTALRGIISYTKDLCCEKNICFVPACNEPDTSFPQKADNERVLFKWNNTENRTQECASNNGLVETARKSCEEEYRCVQEVEEDPFMCKEEISSYVLPSNGTFHEDISLPGVDFGLHYSSGNKENNTIAYGWSIASHIVIEEDDKIVIGAKKRIGTKNITMTNNEENNISNINIDGKEYVFNENKEHILTKDVATGKTLFIFNYEDEKLTSVKDYFGSVTTIERDASGNVVSITSPHGQKTYLNIDNAGNLAEIRYEDDSAYRFEYEGHLMTVETEPNGNSFLHYFNDAGKVVKVVDAENGEWAFEYPAGVNTLLMSSSNVVRASGDSTKYKNHALKSAVMKSERETESGDIIIRDSAVNDSSSVMTICGQTTKKEYSLVKDPISNKRQLKKIVETTPNGLVKSVNFNKSYTFDSDRLLKSVNNVNRNGKDFVSVKDYNLSTEISTSAEGIISSSNFDKDSLLTLSSVYGDLIETTYEYDELGRILKESQGNRIVSYSYDSKGNVDSIIDVNGDATSYNYDVLGRVIEIIYPDGHSTNFSYDKNGNMTTLIVPTPADHTFVYNGVNKRVSYNSPMNKATSYVYDKQRRIVEVKKPSGSFIGYNYSEGRLQSVNSSDKEVKYEYSCLNNVSSIKSGDEIISFEHDGSLITSMSQSGILNETVDFVYNNDFAIKSVSYDGDSTSLSYNNDGMIVKSGVFNIERNPLNGLAINITDNVFNQKRKYNNYGELKSVDDSVYKYSLKRDKLKISSMKDEIVRLIPKKKGKGFAKEVIKTNYSYSYDNRGRLVEVKSGKKVVEAYSYDNNGNRSSATVNGVSIEASYTLDDNLVVYGENSYRYSKDGYLVEKVTPEGSTLYNYGIQGELKSVKLSDERTISYLQNANNQRVAKLIDGVIVEKYLWLDLTTLLAVYDSNDNLSQRFEYADMRMPVSMVSNGIRYYMHYNQIGSLRAISDSSGNIVREISYDSYGNILSETGSINVVFGFAGGLYDKDTSLTRFGYRDYDSYTGKWTAKDPIGFDGGDMNLYGYVLGDPVNFVDPKGLNPISDWINDLFMPDKNFQDIFESIPKYKNAETCDEKVNVMNDICNNQKGTVYAKPCYDTLKSIYSECIMSCQK